ncbi:L-threonylcarbamoyladenylate synthase [Bacillaceae bacterium S4-13-58]
MGTTKWNVTTDLTPNDKNNINQAAQHVQMGDVIAFPTETVYGLGADATNPLAIKKIYEAKGRPSDNPLIVHVAQKGDLLLVAANIPSLAEGIIDAFMPGPLTLILPSNGQAAENVTAGLSTVGVRIPDHPVALEFIKACGCPIAAPSANRSGRPSPTTAQHVLLDLDGKIAGILDGGPTGVGVESTVLDVTGEIPEILRPGGVTREEIEKVIGTIVLDPSLTEEKEKPKSPGMKYTHYAPEVPLYIVDGPFSWVDQKIEELHQQGKRVGFITADEHLMKIPNDGSPPEDWNVEQILSYGSSKRPEDIAKNLYSTLRSFSRERVDVILCEPVSPVGIGVAVMNRLEKAATGVWMA